LNVELKIRLISGRISVICPQRISGRWKNWNVYYGCAGYWFDRYMTFSWAGYPVKSVSRCIPNKYINLLLLLLRKKCIFSSSKISYFASWNLLNTVPGSVNTEWSAELTAYVAIWGNLILSYCMKTKNKYKKSTWPGLKNNFQ
jgi:hypothetical protein